MCDCDANIIAGCRQACECRCPRASGVRNALKNTVCWIDRRIDWMSDQCLNYQMLTTSPLDRTRELALFVDLTRWRSVLSLWPMVIVTGYWVLLNARRTGSGRISRPVSHPRMHADAAARMMAAF